MTGAGNLEQMGLFLLFARAFLFGGDIIAAEGYRNHIIGGAVNQPLACLGNRKLHRIGFAVVVWHLAGHAVKELDNGVVAEVEIESALQVYHASERDDASKARLVSGEAKSELASGGVASHYDSRGIQVVCVRILQNEIISGANVGESTGPASAIVTDAAVFEVGGCNSSGSERRAKMTCVIQVVLSAPETSMNVDDQGVRGFFFCRRQTQVE